MDFAFTGLSFYRSSKASSLARVNPVGGDVKINLVQWGKLPEAHKIYVLCHEEGHYLLNTDDEMLADQYASKKYLEAGYPISESVKALTRYLNEKNPVHYARGWAQYQRALEFDSKRNKNKKADRPHYETVPEIKKNLMLFIDPATRRLHMPDDPDAFGNDGDGWGGTDYYDFLGIGGSKAERKAKRADRVANRKEKRTLRNESKKSRIEARRTKSQAGLELAKQGIQQTTAGDNIADGLAGAAQGITGAMTGGMLGGGAGGGLLGGLLGGSQPMTNGDMISQQQMQGDPYNQYQQDYEHQDPNTYNPGTYTDPNAYYPPAPPAEPKSKTGMWIAIIGGIALLAVAAILLIPKNK